MANKFCIGRNILSSQHFQNISLLIVAGLLFWFLPSGLWDIQGPDEGRYVQVAKELLSTHNWFLLTIHDVPYDQKPPLPFWMFAGMLKLAGGEVVGWAVRTPAILFALLTLVLTYLIGHRLFSTRAGLYAALVLMTSVRFFCDVPSAELNILFTGWTTLAMAVWLFRGESVKMSWAMAALMWLALAGGFFTKGPLIFLIVFSAIGMEAVYLRNRSVLWAARPLVYFTVLLAMIGGWFVIQSRLASTGFVSEQVTEQTLERFFSGSHAEPFYYYIPRIFTVIFAPWAILLIPAGMRLWRARRRLSRQMAAILGWIIIPFLILTLAHGKRQTYLLPLLPAMALVVGWFLDRVVSEGSAYPRFSRFLAILEICGGLAGGVFVLLLVVFTGKFHQLDLNVQPLGYVILVLSCMAMVFIGVWLNRCRMVPSAPIWSLVGFMFMLGLINNCTIKPAFNADKSTRELSQTIEVMIRQYGLPARIGGIGDTSEPHYHVYGHYGVVSLNEDEFPDPPVDLPGILLCMRRNMEDVEGEQALKQYHLEREMSVTDKDFLILLHNDLATPKATLPH